MIKFSKEKVKLLHQLISEETGLAVAAGTMGYQELLNWVIDHRA